MRKNAAILDLDWSTRWCQRTFHLLRCCEECVLFICAMCLFPIIKGVKTCVRNKLEDFLMKLLSPCGKFCSCPFSKSKDAHTCLIYIFFIIPLRRSKNNFFFQLLKAVSATKWHESFFIKIKFVPNSGRFAEKKKTSKCRAPFRVWTLEAVQIVQTPYLLEPQESVSRAGSGEQWITWACTSRCDIAAGLRECLSYCHPRGDWPPSLSAPAAALSNRSKSSRLQPATPDRP